MSTTFLLVAFVCLKERTCKTRKKGFLFHFESSFRSRDNQILTFQITGQLCNTTKRMIFIKNFIKMWPGN